MEEYKVIISPAAQNDFHDVIEHMNTLPHEAAAASFDLFMDKIDALRITPESRPLAWDAQLRLRGYRLLPIESYIVFYVITGNIVEIRRMLYTRRQYEKLF